MTNSIKQIEKPGNSYSTKPGLSYDFNSLLRFEQLIAILGELSQSQPGGEFSTTNVVDKYFELSGEERNEESERKIRNSFTTYISKIGSGTAQEIIDLKLSDPEKYKKREYLLTDTVAPALGMIKHSGRGWFKVCGATKVKIGHVQRGDKTQAVIVSPAAPPVSLDSAPQHGTILGETKASPDTKNVLATLYIYDKPVDVYEISRITEIPIERVGRLLTCLKQLGFVERTGRSWYLYR